MLAMKTPSRFFTVLAVALFAPLCSRACTAILVGKKASATGRTIVAHNEDHYSGCFMRHAYLPRREGAAAAFWSEVKAHEGKQPIAHAFFNEHGVIVFSNNGGVVNEWGGRKFSLPDEGEYSSLSEGGIGYRLRCDMIDRARTAREGVDIMTNLVSRFGYTKPSRLFTIADRDEIWVVEVLQGRRFVARRCPDDAVAVFPNCLTVNKILPGDVVSRNILAKGPDFDFISFYQGPRDWKSPYNLHRWQDAYRIAAGVDVKADGGYPFSVKPAHKVSVDDLKRALSSHYEGMAWAVNPRHPKNNQKDVQPICRATTLESLICVMGATPAESEIHRTVGRPCENEYVVFRPHAGELPPGGATGDEAIRRLRDHDLPPDHAPSAKPDRPRADAGR